MFFVFSKALGFFTQASNLILLLGLIGWAMVLIRWRRTGTVIVSASLVLLALCGLSPLGDALLLPLSERFAPWRDEGRAPTGIIVLGGSISPEISAARGMPELNASAERLTIVAQLARKYPDAKIVFSGGNNAIAASALSEAAVAGSLFESFAIAPERIVLERRSRTTAENASDTRALVQPKDGEVWLLVTSAFHMPRSIGVFRAAGFDVEAYPVDFRTTGWRDALIPFDRVSDGLLRTDTALHEWIGLVAYRLAGRTHELFPGPLNRDGAGPPDRRP